MYYQQRGIELRAFLSIVITLIIVGLIFIYSASSVFALERFGSASYFAKKQLMGIVLGGVLAFIVGMVPYNFFKKASPLFFLVSLILTALTLVPGLGVKIHGSSRWLKLGISFQPSELLKIGLILYTAYFLERKKNTVSSFVKTYLPLFVVAGASFGVLLMQPDFGMTVTLALTIFAMLFIANFHSVYLLWTTASLVPVAIALVAFKPYRLRRILTFMNPWEDPQGAGFQVIQSLIAVGSGGYCGKGISCSKQKFFYLPMQHTDFIFSIIAEEVGFLGSMIVVFLFLLLVYFGIRIALQLRDDFAVFSALGFIILISLQAIINIGVATGLLPTKGIGLPFLSYGSSSILCLLLMVGMIVSFFKESGFGSRARF
jgi:cell division protein FtsW